MNAKCDPSWHEGQAVPAEYMVANTVDRTPTIFAPPLYEVSAGTFHYTAHFAVCAEHVERALKVMMVRSPRVLVWRVEP